MHARDWGVASECHVANARVISCEILPRPLPYAVEKSGRKSQHSGGVG